ncbi:hypothetical protein WMY93_009036 [Mugilogobius chulae]|uniref:Uncharacterized protein n=1 Tax=Mugilogobius chulae TaxID=88201 RepID=A0AAW0PGU4_9GOBI
MVSEWERCDTDRGHAHAADTTLLSAWRVHRDLCHTLQLMRLLTIDTSSPETRPIALSLHSLHTGAISQPLVSDTSSCWVFTVTAFAFFPVFIKDPSSLSHIYYGPVCRSVSRTNKAMPREMEKRGRVVTAEELQSSSALPPERVCASEDTGATLLCLI